MAGSGAANQSKMAERGTRRAGAWEPRLVTLWRESALGGGRTLSPVPALWVSKAPLGSSLAFQLQTLRMRPALGPRWGQGLTLWLFTPPPPAEGKGKGEGWGAVTTRGIAEVNGLF